MKNAHQFNTLHDTAMDIVDSAVHLEGVYPFEFKLVRKIFQADNRRLSNNLEWVFEGHNIESMNSRMLLVLREEGTEFKNLESKHDQEFYASSVVKRLKDFYNV